MHGRLEAGVTRYCLSSKGAARHHAGDAPEASPSVRKRRSRPALPLFVRSRRAADLESGARIWPNASVGTRRGLLAGTRGCPAGPARCFWRISGLSCGALQVLLRCWHGYVAPERTLPHAARPSAARCRGRASPGRSTHRSRTRLVRRLQRQHSMVRADRGERSLARRSEHLHGGADRRAPVRLTRASSQRRRRCPLLARSPAAPAMTSQPVWRRRA
jgi:hypothetical protein